MTAIITEDTIESLIDIKSEPIGAERWKAIVSFNDKKETFTINSKKDPAEYKLRFLSNILSPVEDFPLGIPDLQEYKDTYFGDDCDMEIVEKAFKEDILEQYIPAVNLFDEQSWRVYTISMFK